MDNFFFQGGSRGSTPYAMQLYVTSLKYEQERDVSATDKQESNATKIDIPIENSQQELTNQPECNVTEVDIPTIIITKNESSDQESNDEDEISTISVPNVTELWNVQKRSWVVLGFFIVICIIGYFTNKIGKARNEKNFYLVIIYICIRVEAYCRLCRGLAAA
jgi:hypothetical protein